MQRVIASVSFREHSATRNYLPMDRRCGYGGYPFKVKACQAGEHDLLVVPDMLSREYLGNGVYSEVPKYADDSGDSHSGVARDIAQEWADHVLGPGGDVGPGIGVIAGTEPTPEELRYLINRQLRYCEWMMIDGEDKWLKGKRGEVTEQHRECALWYAAQCELDGVPVRPAFQNLQWVTIRPGDKVELGECWRCFQKYDMRVATCPQGHIVNVEKHRQNLIRQAEIDAMLKEMQEQFAAPAAAGPTPEPDDDDPDDPDDARPAGQIKRHVCADCGAEFDRTKQLVQHRMNECAKKSVGV